MKKQRKLETAFDPTWKVTILSVSPYNEDQSSLEAIIGHSRWMLFKARDLVSTLAVLKRQAISVLLCDRDLLPGKWTEVMEQANAMPNAPSLIVTSRLADDRLWAEALNLGAWDVLAKPFHVTEVIRSIRSAWQHWHDERDLRATASMMMSAAS